MYKLRKLGKKYLTTFHPPKYEGYCDTRNTSRILKRILLQRKKFYLLVRVVGKSFKNCVRWQPSAILTLRYTSEDYLNEVIEKSSFAAGHAKHRTTQPVEINLVHRISKN